MNTDVFRTHVLIGIVLLLSITGGCSNLFVEPETSGEPEAVFDLLWSEFDRYYPFFIDKNINWDSVYTIYRPRIGNEMTEDDLFEVISDMLLILRDGHVNVYTPLDTSAYTGWYDQYPRNFYYNIIVNHYLRLNRNTTGGGNIIYGKIHEIGYIYIQSFSGEGNWVLSIDEVIEELYDLDGIIVDIRHNSGGSSNDANIIASRFADHERVYSYAQFRNGPDHSSFTPLRNRTIAPGGRLQFRKPVALLTNRSTFSASENFTLAMKEFPHVTHFGDTTGGGLGSPVFRELPNGWGFRIPVLRQLSRELVLVEGIGIAPDVKVDIRAGDLLLQRDTILDEALNLLRP
jgi:hypothetical protein